MLWHRMRFKCILSEWSMLLLRRLRRGSYSRLQTYLRLYVLFHCSSHRISPNNLLILRYKLANVFILLAINSMFELIWSAGAHLLCSNALFQPHAPESDVGWMLTAGRADASASRVLLVIRINSAILLRGVSCQYHCLKVILHEIGAKLFHQSQMETSPSKWSRE